MTASDSRRHACHPHCLRRSESAAFAVTESWASTRRQSGRAYGAVVGTYSMAIGESDAARLDLVDRVYNPSSRAFCESAGMAEGDSVADIGCGHGSMTRWFAEQVGPNGLVYAVDASAQQLEIARGALRELTRVRRTTQQQRSSLSQARFSSCVRAPVKHECRSASTPQIRDLWRLYGQVASVRTG
jgi:predicted methyltransferase